MQSIFIGRQPIINSHSELCAYEILYKGSEAVLNRFSSASIINNVLNKFGTTSILGNRRGFIKVDESFLMHDIIFSIPSEFFIFSLIATTTMSEKVVERIDTLHEKGYMLSLDNLILNADSMYKFKSIFSKLAFVKLNIEKSSRLELANLIQKLKNDAITVVADNISDEDAYIEAKEFGCDWFQGYFFAKPKIIENQKHEPTNISVLRLYNMLIEDVNIEEITEEFERNPEISVQLLRFINSGAFSFRNKISSIHHVLTLVGRRPLSQWLMLMIYSKSVSNDSQSPLMLMVKNRTQLMESILKLIEPTVDKVRVSEAYFVGILSLIETLFSRKLEDILYEMNISRGVELALIKKEGLLGEILELIIDIEKFNTEAIYKFEKRYKLEKLSIEHLAIESMKSVNKFEKAQKK